MPTLATALTTGLTAALLIASPAQAAQPTGTAATGAAAAGAATGSASGAAAGVAAADADASVQAATAATVTARLGDRVAGAYLDRSSGRMVVTVTDAAAAAEARTAGVAARVVSHSRAQLTQATTDLAATARIPGTAWVVDPVANQVVVSYDATVTGARLEQLRAAVDRLGATARLESVGGTFTTRIAGGDAIYGNNGRCSLGFNVRSGSTYGFLTAGHCGNIIATWYSDSAKRTLLGTRAGSSFPGNDYALVKYTNSAIVVDGTVDLYNGSSQDITGAGDAYVGQAVRRSGSTTRVRSGTVTGLDATVNYTEGSVSGLIRTNVCAERGDSGGSLFAGSLALGLTSGGNGNCTYGGTTYFQPVKEALSAYGMSVF